MSPAEIKRRLLKVNVSAASLARKLDVSRQTVSSAVNGGGGAPWVRRAIAETIGLPYATVWGEEDPGVDRLRVLPGLPAVSTVVNGAGRAA